MGILLEAEGLDKEDVNKKLNDKIKNLRLYLNLYTDNEIQINQYGRNNHYPDKKEFDKNIKNTLDSLKEQNLTSFVNGRITQQRILLQTALDEVNRGDMFNGFPKLINWLDDNDGKGSSRFCKIRDVCSHGITDDAILKVEELFPGEFEFEENTLKRNSQKNIDSMKSHLPEVIEHVKDIFKRDFMNST